MIELAFVVCLRSMPDLCEERRMPSAELGLVACMRQAQPELVRWVEAHPDLRVTRWSCQWADATQAEA